MDKTPREVWEQRVKAWKQSGMTSREFASLNGFHVKTFENRKYWLARRQREGVLARGGMPLKPSGFVEVATVPVVRRRTAPSTGQRVSQEMAEPFELVLGGGIRLRIPPRFEAQAPRALLVALEGR